MTGMRRYYLDSPIGDEAHGRDVQDLYATVIRKLGQPGWVFRFTAGDLRGANEALAMLNWPGRS